MSRTEAWRPAHVREKNLVETLEACDGLPLSADDLADELGVTRMRIGQLAKRLVTRGVVTRSGRGYKGDPYQYRLGGRS